MEWMNRGDQRQGQPAGQPATAAAGSTKKASLKNLRTWKIAQVALLFCITILVVAVVWFVALGGNNKEASYVDNGKLQAVFLNGGQVYFGKINDLNGKFLSMSGIYYLRVNQQVQPNQSSSSNSNDISLVKLGCELHGPQDNMVINREQVIFWENLKDDGQVAKAVKTYQEQNPGAQKCDQSSSSSQTQTQTNTDANASDTSNTTTNTNTTTNNSATTNNKKTN
jgi:hypothetical protein